MKSKLGFTLIELLAVIIILGVIILIAVPNISTMILESKYKTYVDSAKVYVDAVRNKVVSKDYIFNSKSTTYYVAIENIDLEREGSSPFGDWQEAYVVIVYDGNSYSYYWTSVDVKGYKATLKKIDDMGISDIKGGSSLVIDTNIGIGARTKIHLIDKDGNEVDKLPTSQL